MNRQNQKKSDTTLTQEVLKGFGLNNRMRAHIASFMMGVGATLGFIYYDETISPTGHAGVDSPTAEIAADIADESPVEEAIHRGVTTLYGGFAGGFLVSCAMGIANLPRDESVSR